MTYVEKRTALMASAAYGRAIKIIAALCAFYAITVDGVILLTAAGSGDLRSGPPVPGGRSGSLTPELLRWVVVAALLFLVCLAVLRFVAPALMTEARLRKLAREQ